MTSEVCCHGFNNPHLSNFNGVLAEASEFLLPLPLLQFEADGFVLYAIAPSFQKGDSAVSLDSCWTYAGLTTISAFPQLQHQDATIPTQTQFTLH